MKLVLNIYNALAPLKGFVCMEGVLKMIQQTHMVNQESMDITSKEQKELIDAIKDVCCQLEYTDKWFQYEEDDDLIEACIYQREVLNAKYRYLIRKAKKENTSIQLLKNKNLLKE